MIALAIILYIKETRSQANYWIYALIALHLVTNFIWTPLFFTMQNPGLALLDIIILDITLALLIYFFWQQQKFAASCHRHHHFPGGRDQGPGRPGRH